VPATSLQLPRMALRGRQGAGGELNFRTLGPTAAEAALDQWSQFRVCDTSHAALGASELALRSPQFRELRAEIRDLERRSRSGRSPTFLNGH